MARHAKRNLRRGPLFIVAGSIAAVAAASSLAGGFTYARLSATTPTQSNKVSAGTVTLASDTSGACGVTGMVPGGAASQCTLKATYSGSVSAYLGLDVLVATKAGSGGTALYTPSVNPTTDLQIAITDNESPTATTFTVPTVGTSCPATGPYMTGYTCYQLDDELVSATPFTSSSGPDTLITTVSLPATNPSGDQGGTAAVVLTVHAVQSANQTLGTCTAGNPCTSIGWS